MWKDDGTIALNMSKDEDEDVVSGDIGAAWHSTFWSAFPSSCCLLPPPLWPLIPRHFLHSVVKMMITHMLMVVTPMMIIRMDCLVLL